MKFQKSTLILILVALMFGGVVYIWEVEGKPRREAAKLQENRIFGFEEKDVQNVVLKTKEHKLQFNRVKPQTASNTIAPKWTLKILERYQTAEIKTSENQTEVNNTEIKIPENEVTETQRSRRNRQEREIPEDLALAFSELMPSNEKLLTEMPANEAYVAFLLTQLTTGKGDRIIADPRIEDGIDKPLATVDITLNNGKKHQLILGNFNYNNTALYALADPPQQLTKPLDILLVPINFQNAVNRPLSEWKQQEIKPTPTTEESKKESPPPTKETPRQRRNREN
jgi:hypothetical protein